MGLNDVLKSVLGDEIYKEKGDALKKELAKEMIPKAEFNDKLDSIKALESEKKLLLEEKVQYEKQIEESKNANLSDLEKLQKNLKALEDKLTKEAELRLQAEQTLNDEKITNSIKSKLSKAEMKAKYIDKYVNDFKDVKEEEFEAKMKEFAENNKELFGKEEIKGKPPEGDFKDNLPKGYETPKTFAEWKEQVRQ